MATSVLAAGGGPIVVGGVPVRTVLHVQDGVIIPAGSGCAFDVIVSPDDDARQAITTFSDGSRLIIGLGAPMLTNADSGTSYQQRSRYSASETLDPVTGLLHVTISGRVFTGLWPGDEGPDGLVAAPGRLLGVIGTTAFVIDPDTQVIVAFENDGPVVDLCAALS